MDMVLAASAASLAILHTLLPDHELPLAMIGRAQKWSIKKMVGVTLVAGTIHISVSVVIGIIALAVSSLLAQRIAMTAHRISGIFLIGFGLVYSILAWRREHVHEHPKGEARDFHVPHAPNKTDQEAHSHGHSHASSKVKVPPDGKAISRSTWLVAIVGIAPCFTLIPVLVDSMWFGTSTVLLVMIVYAVSTIGSMVILTSIALKTITFLTRLERIERHIEILAGIVILAVGLYVVLPEMLFPAHSHI